MKAARSVIDDDGCEYLTWTAYLVEFYLLGYKLKPRIEQVIFTTITLVDCEQIKKEIDWDIELKDRHNFRGLRR